MRAVKTVLDFDTILLIISTFLPSSKETIFGKKHFDREFCVRAASDRAGRQRSV
jgi:hypothetical protein